MLVRVGGSLLGFDFNSVFNSYFGFCFSFDLNSSFNSSFRFCFRFH